MSTKKNIVTIDGKITNKALGIIQQHMSEIVRRIEEGTIDYDWAIEEIRRIIGWRPPIILNWNVWKTITLGTYKTVDTLCAALKKGGYMVSEWANDMMNQPTFTISQSQIQLDLVNISNIDLGFPNGATCGNVYKRALQLGLELCPNEVGPIVRLNYQDQPKGEWIAIAMESITGSHGDQHVFYVGHDDNDRYLNGPYGLATHFRIGRARWVFARRKLK